MTKEMIMDQIVPEDPIAITAYGIDLHSPEVGGQNVLFYLEPGQYYGVPYGVMVPETGWRICWLPGKCVSADDDATSGVLCSGICMAMGEGGTGASALSIREGVTPAEYGCEEDSKPWSPTERSLIGACRSLKHTRSVNPFKGHPELLKNICNKSPIWGLLQLIFCGQPF